MKPCADIRGFLVGDVHGDLHALEKAVVDAHLARCPACTDLRATLAAGLQAARVDIPVDVEHLVALVHAAPTAPPTPKPRRALFAFVGVAASAAAALVVVAVHAPNIAPRSGARPVEAAAPSTLAPGVDGAVASTNASGLQTDSAASSTSTHALGASSSTTAHGVNGANGGALAGVAGLSARKFEAGTAPDRAARARPKRAGLHVDERGPSTPSPVGVDVDASLAAAQAEVAATGTLDELLPRLDEADRLARAGDGDEALARYHTLERDPRFARYGDLIRYQRARLQGLVLGDVDVAVAELAKLKGSAVADQAALTRCEVERTRDPCAALACLDAVTGAAAADAHRLRDRWSSSCPSH